MQTAVSQVDFVNSIRDRYRDTNALLTTAAILVCHQRSKLRLILLLLLLLLLLLFQALMYSVRFSDSRAARGVECGHGLDGLRSTRNS